MRTLLASLALVVAVPAAAHADGFVEFAGGIAQPIADDDYENNFDTHIQFGARFGSVSDAPGSTRLGFELGLNYSPLNDDYGLDEISVHRFRVTGGVRAVHAIGGDAVIIARVAAGIEYVRADWAFEVLGTRFEGDIDDTGLVIDPGVGFLIGGGSTRLGGFIGLPIAFHDEVEDNINVEYTAVDIDLLFVVSTAL
jgi:hypothetical protein